MKSRDHQQKFLGLAKNAVHSEINLGLFDCPKIIDRLKVVFKLSFLFVHNCPDNGRVCCKAIAIIPFGSYGQSYIPVSSAVFPSYTSSSDNLGDYIVVITETTLRSSSYAPLRFQFR